MVISYKTFFSHLEALPLRDLLHHTRTLLVQTNQALQALEEDTVTADMMKLHFLPELILEDEIKQHSVSAVKIFRKIQFSPINLFFPEATESRCVQQRGDWWRGRFVLG